jgi:hypothetical protein
MTCQSSNSDLPLLANMTRLAWEGLCFNSSGAMLCTSANIEVPAYLLGLG